MVINAVGHLAEAAWHHPDLTASYAWVEVRLMTHDHKGITDKDFELAKKIEEVVQWQPGPGRRGARGHARGRSCASPTSSTTSPRLELPARIARPGGRYGLAAIRPPGEASWLRWQGWSARWSARSARWAATISRSRSTAPRCVWSARLRRRRRRVRAAGDRGAARDRGSSRRRWTAACARAAELLRAQLAAAVRRPRHRRRRHARGSGAGRADRRHRRSCRLAAACSPICARCRTAAG